MTYEEARAFQKEVGCRHALATALKSTSRLTPLPNDDAVVVCKEKVRRGDTDDVCHGRCQGARR